MMTWAHLGSVYVFASCIRSYLIRTQLGIIYDHLTGLLRSFATSIVIDTPVNSLKFVVSISIVASLPARADSAITVPGHPL